MKKIIIGSDKSGFQLKEAVKAHLVEAGYEVTDAGSQSEENAMFYYEAAENVAPRVGGGEFEKGILICGTGMGMSIVANTKVYTLQFARIHTQQRNQEQSIMPTFLQWVVGSQAKLWDARSQIHF